MPIVGYAVVQGIDARPADWPTTPALEPSQRAVLNDAASKLSTRRNIPVAPAGGGGGGGGGGGSLPGGGPLDSVLVHEATVALNAGPPSQEIVGTWL